MRRPVLASWLHSRGLNVRRLALVLLATAALLAGCGSHSSVPASPPERVTLTQTPDAGTNYVAIIGDSYTAGSPIGGHGAHGWPAVAAAQLRAQGLGITPVIGALGASGYVSPGHQQAGLFIDQVERVVGANDRLVVLFGSRNDEEVSADQLTPAVHRAFAEAKAKAPTSKFLVISPIWVNADPSPGILQNRDILKAGAEAIGATFIDPIADEWFLDRPDLIGSDGQHPTDEGHVYMADRIAPVIAQLLQAPAA